MKRFASGFAVALSLAMQCTASADVRGPIVPSAVSEADAERIALEGGGDPSQIRQSIRDGELGAVYFNDEFRRLFPEIGTDEVRAFHCQISLASPPSARLAFVQPSATTKNKANVHLLDCTYRPAGLYCALSSSEAFYADDPRQFFTLEDVTLEDGLEVLRLLGPNEPDWTVSTIRKSGSAYTLTFGRAGCACRGETIVEKRSFLWFSWLVTLSPLQPTCR